MVGRAEGTAVAEPLIGVDDMETPYWVQHVENVAHARLSEVAVAVPAVGGPRRALGVARRTRPDGGRRVLELLTGAVQAFGLLATTGVFTRLPAAGPTPDRVVAALPALAVVVAAYAGRGCSTRWPGRPGPRSAAGGRRTSCTWR